MKILKTALLALVLSVVWSSTAFAKPGHAKPDYPLISSIMLTGPGIDGRMTITDEDDALAIARAAGVEGALRRGTPGPDLEPPAEADLGAEYVVMYRVNVWRAAEMGVPVVVTQRIYPFAEGGPWAFVEPRSGLVADGWWPVQAGVTRALTDAGVPAPDTARAAQTGGADLSALLVATMVAAASTLVFAAVALRLRRRPALGASH